MDTVGNAQLYHGDCLEVMQGLPDGCVDMILADLPYGTTACSWDTVIPFEPLWEAYKRIIKDNGAIVLTASQPFTSALIMSNIDMFKYEWIWEKSQAVGHLNAWKRPMRKTEDILIFYKKQCAYNPQITDKIAKNIRPATKRTKQTDCYGSHKLDIHKCCNNKSMPSNIIKFNNQQQTIHPTQKPVELMEYLIRTYTNKGETVLDNTMGSGTTGVACEQTNRKFIGIEISEEYYNIAKDRIFHAQPPLL